jgi:hypothetical protein
VAKSAEPPDPLRLVPPVADIVVKIDEPRAIADLLVQLAARPELNGFRGYRDYFASTNYQLFRQLVAHFEHELGHPWPELVDSVAGGGIVLAVKIESKKKAPALVILQGKDPKLTAQFFNNLRQVVADEQARQGVVEKYASEKYRGVDTYHLGDELYAVVLDAALVYANMPEALHAAIDQHLDPAKPSLLKEKSLDDAKKLVPSGSLAWVWLNLAYAHQSPDLKPLFTLPSNFFPTHVLFGGAVDALRRAPFVVAAIHPELGGLALSVRLPCGTSGMHDLVRAHVPPPGQAGALPLLMPSGTLFSTSFYLDLAAFWDQRAALLPPDQLKQAEENDKKSGFVLQGTRFSEFLKYAGTRHRIVVAQQSDTGYRVQPETHYPAFGWVMELREPEKFETAIDRVLNGLAFLVGTQVPLKRVEETYAGAKIVGYRIVENDENKARNEGTLFNISPCRARIGKQYIVCSTLDLMHRLIDAVQKESTSAAVSSSSAKSTASTDSTVTILRSRVAWSGISSYLNGVKRQMVTRNMLEQGNSPGDAAKEVSLMLELLDHLGRIESTNRIGPDQYELDLRISMF